MVLFIFSGAETKTQGSCMPSAGSVVELLWCPEDSWRVQLMEGELADLSPRSCAMGKKAIALLNLSFPMCGTGQMSLV